MNQLKNMERKWIYEAIFWLLVAYLFLFAILKALGYIKTQIVDISPLLATGILVLYLKLYLEKSINSLFEKT